MTRWLRYPSNLLCHGLWTDCAHPRRRLVKHYFLECPDCGALFDEWPDAPRRPLVTEAGERTERNGAE